MAYTIRNTRGDTLKTITDGTLDSTLPIKLYGKNYLGYGEGLQNNLVAILENFTKDTEPSAPLKGQLWYDNANLDLKIYNGTAFVQAIKTVANLSAGNVTVTGNLSIANVNFTNTVTGPQFVSNVTVGNPPLSVISTTQVANLNVAVAGNLINGNSNVIVNANSYVTISVGGTAEVVNVATTGITVTGNVSASNLSTGGILSVTGNANTGNLGTTTIIATTANLTTINSGLMQNGTSNVSITSGGNVTTYIGGNATAQMVVTATGANIAGTANVTGNANVGNLGTATAIITTGNITTINSGLMKNGTSNITVNASGNVNVSVGGTANVLNVTSAGITVQNAIVTSGSVAGYTVSRRDTNAATHVIYSAAGTLSVYDAVGAVDRLHLTASGNLYPNANASQHLGLTTNRWSNIWGVASSAQYADLAERYQSDADYEPGTVLEIGGEHEITVCNTPRSTEVFGCVSTNPAYLMNDDNKEGIWLPVVLTGRAPIKAVGIIRKGDRLVSAGNGAAMAAGVYGSSYQNEIGRALEDKNTEEMGLVEAYISTK